jgi:DNA-binding MarR family transcriptional regulator
MNKDFRSMGEIDRLIHEPARMMIVAILYNWHSVDYLYLLRETGLTKGNLTSHLSKLEAAGYIEIEKTFKGKVPLTICHLSDKGRGAFEAYREHLKQIVESTGQENITLTEGLEPFSG